MIKYFILLFVFNFSLAQSTLMINAEESNINYSAKHVLHAWEGVNDNIKGVIIYDAVYPQLLLQLK